MQVWLLFIFLFITHCHAIFWCLFVDCNNKGRSNDGFIEVDQDWIQPEKSEEILYHFANQEVNAMNWYEANDYCLDKGGYLAEPHNSEETEFLKNFASKFPNVNWWIGAREGENCKCSTNDGRSKTIIEFDATIDYKSLTGQKGENGFVQTKCPQRYQKTCFGNVWLWSLTGVHLEFEDWNRQSGEPNGETEHCSALWIKGDYRWSDWLCKTTSDNNHSFKPICQKDVSNGYDDYDTLSDETQCFDRGVTYKSAKRDKLESINGVESAKVCQQLCQSNNQCNYWTWLQKRRGNTKCRLKSGILSSRFRREKLNAVSGTLLKDECNADLIVNPRFVTK